MRVDHPHFTVAPECDPPAVGCPDRARVGVEAVEGMEAIERDDGRGADRAVQADRDDYEFGVAQRGVRRTGHPAERQPRSVRRPCGTRLVGRIRSGYFEPTGVLARPDEVDVAAAGLTGVECYPPVHDRRGRSRVGDDGGDGRSRFGIAGPPQGEGNDARRDERETGGRGQPTRSRMEAGCDDVEIERGSFRDTQRLRLGAKRAAEGVLEDRHLPTCLESAAGRETPVT